MAMEIDFTVDGGAYETLSPVVLSRGTIHAAGPYDCPNVRIAAGLWRRMRRRMERFADLARRKVFLRWSGIWIVSRRRWESRQKNCGGGILFMKARLWLWGRW